MQYNLRAVLYNTCRQGAIFHSRVSNSKIILHQFHVDKNEGKYVIGYDMLIGCERLLANFNHQVLQQDVVTVPMKEPIGMIGKTYLTSSVIRKVIIQTVKPVSTREDTERLVKILDRTNAKE